MDATIIAAIIGAAGGIVSTLIPLVITPLLTSIKYRSKNKIPEILYRWESEWYIKDTLYSKGICELEKWTKNSRFEGTGQDPKGPYKLYGEIDSSRFVVGSYVDTEYPTLGYIGAFILELSIDGKIMEGYWHGRTTGGDIEGGRVVFRRI